MKKIITLAFLLNLFLATAVFAQSPTPNDAYATAYQTYIDKNGIYQSAHNDYLTARASYFASGSLDSQAKAMAATLKMLKARDSVMVAYLLALKTKVTSSSGVSDVDKSSVSSSVDSEVSFYNTHNTKLDSAGSLNDLVSDSDEAKAQYTNSTALNIYTGLIDLGMGENNSIRTQIVNEITILRAKIDEIKANQDKDVSTIERYLVDVQNKISRSSDKDNTAKTLIGSIKPSDSGISNAFNDAQTALTDSNSYLKEANQQLLQIITLIKTN